MDQNSTNTQPFVSTSSLIVRSPLQGLNKVKLTQEIPPKNPKLCLARSKDLINYKLLPNKDPILIGPLCIGMFSIFLWFFFANNIINDVNQKI